MPLLLSSSSSASSCCGCFMALKCASSQTLIQKSRLFRFQDSNQRFHVPLLLRKTLLPSSSLRISASINNKLYEVEDESAEGIVCYRDERSGEIICEGYDEGPRFPRRKPTPTHHPRFLYTDIIYRLIKYVCSTQTSCGFQQPLFRLFSIF